MAIIKRNVARILREAAFVPLTGKEEALRFDLYSFDKYPQAGTTQMNFFSVPVGQTLPSGITATLEWTNMEIPNAISSPKRFTVEEISIEFYPDPEYITYYNGSTSAYYEAYKVLSTGSYIFKVMDKDYFVGAPLLRLPARVRMLGSVSDNLSASHSSLGFPQGDGYSIYPPMTLLANMNFTFVLKWTTPVAVSSSNHKIGVVLSGHIVRPGQ